MKRTVLTIILIVFPLSVAFGQDIVILHTNDTHSQIEPVRAGKGKGMGGIHRRAEYFKQVKAENENVLILDAGDYNQGTPYFTVFKGDLEVELMNELGYDVATLGNHEFDNGMEELARRLAKAEYVTVCANYDFKGTPLEKYIKPYVIVEKGGRKIGVFGLLRDIRTLVSRQNSEGMVYHDIYDVADETAELLKEDEGCDIVIALTHIGYSAAGNGASDIELAKRTENIDIIIGGHSHTFLKSERIYQNREGEDVIVVQAGCSGEWVGRFDISFK